MRKRMPNWMAPFLALLLSTLQIRLLNTALFPFYGSMIPWSREACVLGGVVTCALVAAAALYRPRLLSEETLAWGSMLLTACGVPISIIGIVGGFPSLLILGSAAFGIGTGWISLLALLACSTLPPRELLVGVPFVYATSSVLAWALGFCPQPLSICALYIAALGTFFLSRPSARSIVLSTASNQPHADAEITRPSSFLPLGNPIFICLLLTAAAAGFGLRFGAQEGSPDLSLLPAGLFTLIALWNMRSSNWERFDQLFHLAILLLVTAFLVVPLRGYTNLALGLIILGNGCLNVVFILAMLCAAVRNQLASVVVIAWGGAMSSIGSVVGANIGAMVRLNQESEGSFLMGAAVAVFLLAYVFLDCAASAFHKR